MEIQPLIKEGDEEPDGLFEQRYNEEGDTTSEQRYHRSQWSRVFEISKDLKISPAIINKCISELSLLDQSERPHYIMVLGGNIVYLIEVEKWFRGSYLSFDIEELFFESTLGKRQYYSLFYLLLSKEMLSPDSELVLMDQLDEDSHKSAYEVTKDLKEGIINAVELLANESLYFQKDILQQEFDESDDTFEQEVKDDCLNIIYRLLFVFYAESRSDLDILPISDQVYQRGYSLEMLRDLEQTQLVTDHSRNGYFFHESLSKLFELMSSGYREDENGRNKSFKIRHIDSPLFDNKKLNHLGEVKFRNFVWQDVICQLSLSKKQRGKVRGRISYANLGINQLGSVYESLLAYRGFYAEEDYIEVHTKNKPQDGTYLVPRSRRDDFHTDEVLRDENGNEVVIQKGRFVYRLSGRDRQKSASYYTPEVLTQCTVKYTLKSILEKVEKGEMSSLELLDLKLLEPAMGAAAFHNELINQLSEAYLNFRQKEVKKKISPEKYREELQRVKAYIATNNTYGVDLNPTAIELGKLSLWLNVIHKDLETPFFANRLAVGNAVVGAWFKTFTTKELKKKWWDCEPQMVSFENGKINRSKNQIYHFLLPDQNMVPSAGIKLLKDEDPDRSKRVSDWKLEVCKPISENEIQQLQKICESIDSLVLEYFEFQKRLNLQTKNKLDVWEGVAREERDSLNQVTLNLRSYDEKEQLNDQRNRQSAPYYKLKMVMDYWCSLWFWDMRNAEFLPSRQQYLNDISSILNVNLSSDSSEQLGSGFEESTLGVAQTQIIRKTEQSDLFVEKERLSLVKDLSIHNRFFHSQLEFIEVFLERGGFDIVVGNPPWIKITFDIVSFYGDYDPLTLVRQMSSPQVQKLLEENFDSLKVEFINEKMLVEGYKEFFKSNFPYTQGKSNLFKLIIENTLRINSKYLGFVIDTGLFDQNGMEDFRSVLYRQLQFLFRFSNDLKLFEEVGGAKKFEVIILNCQKSKQVDFQMINNLYHPKSIDTSFIIDDGQVYGIKDDKNQIELRSNKQRIIKVDEEVLKSVGTILEPEVRDLHHVKIPQLHDTSSINVLKKVSLFPTRVSNIDNVVSTQMINETNGQKDKLIEKFSDYVTVNEFVYSGPHYYVANPLNKTPNENCKNHLDYTQIDLTGIGEDYLPRTLFRRIGEVKEVHDDYYHIHRRRALNTNERTLIGTLIPPNIPHTNGSISIKFENLEDTVSFSACSSSIIYDYLIRITGSGDIWFSLVRNLPFIKNPSIYIINRYLRLVSVNTYYSELWNKYHQCLPKDDRLTGPLNHINDMIDGEYSYHIPFRSDYQRRQALLEIDVIVSISLNLTLEDLIKIYSIQFPVFKKNDEKIIYDKNGNLSEEGTRVNRVEDYKIAWDHFEKIFNQN
jgi:hypothetical protein